MEDDMALLEDVLIEFLVSLPVKSLMRFSCVSKYWCDLIKSPSFVSWHLRRNSNESVLLKRLTYGGGRGREAFSFHDPDSPDLLVSPSLSIPPFLDYSVNFQFFDYMSTCNGLVCLALREKVILCNPALQEFELLPPSQFVCPEGYHAQCILTGFGHDAVTDAYKVVQLCMIEDMEEEFPKNCEDAWMRVDLYNSSTNSWRPIDAGILRARDIVGFCLLFNGACHWHSHEFDCYHGIISFDLSTEAFQQFEYPDFEDIDKNSCLAVLNQCLSVVVFGQLIVVPQPVDIWVMREYGVRESWTKEFVIGPYLFNCPLLFLKNEWLLVETFNHQLASCALHGNETKIFRFRGAEDSMRAVMFRESLVSVKQVIHGKPQ